MYLLCEHVHELNRQGDSKHKTISTYRKQILSFGFYSCLTQYTFLGISRNRITDNNFV